jgi:hypothetical protein
MHRIAPSEKDAANDTLEKRLWVAVARGSGRGPQRNSRMDEPVACHAEGVLYLTPNAQIQNFHRTRDLLLLMWQAALASMAQARHNEASER